MSGTGQNVSHNSRREDVSMLVRCSPWYYAGLSDEERNCYTTALYAVTGCGNMLAYVPEPLRKDRTILRASVMQCGAAIRLVNRLVQETAFDDTMVNVAVHTHPLLLGKVNPWFRGEKDTVLAAVHSNGLAAAQASPLLKRDAEVALVAVTQNGKALEFFSREIQAMRTVVLAAVRSRGMALKYAAPLLRDDEDVVLEAVRSSGAALKYASTHFRSCPKTCLAACSNDAKAYDFVAPCLAADFQIAIAAIKNNPLVFSKLPAHLQAMKTIAMATVEGKPSKYVHLNSSLREDKEVLLHALRSVACSDHRPFSLGIVPRSLLRDHDILAAWTVFSNDTLYWVDDSARRDKNLVLRLVKIRGASIRFASDEMMKDKDVLLAAARTFPEVASHESICLDRVAVATLCVWSAEVMAFAHPSLQEDAQFVSGLLQSNVEVLRFVGGSGVRFDISVARVAVQVNGRSLCYFSSSVRSDVEICRLAIENNGFAWNYVSDGLRSNMELQNLAICSSCGGILDSILSTVILSEERQREKVLLACSVAQGSYFKHDVASSLRYCSFAIRDDESIVSKMADLDGIAIKHASNRLCSLRSVVMTAISHDGNLLRFASGRLRSDPDVVMAAVMTDPASLAFAFGPALDDKKIAFYVVARHPPAFHWLSRRLRGDQSLRSLAFAERGGHGALTSPSDFIEGILASETEKDEGVVESIAELAHACGGMHPSISAVCEEIVAAKACPLSLLGKRDRKLFAKMP